MSIEESYEYKGYGYLYAIFRNIARPFVRIGKRCNKIADKLRFEQYKMIFGERDDDIYIVTYPKSGTTLMQVIMYQLTTDGNMDFNHIYNVSPWIRNACIKKQKPFTLPSPRIIKSHDKYSTFEKDVKGRFIFVYRDGKDVAVSHYNQHKNYNNSELTFDRYMSDFLKTEAWFKYCKSWIENKKKLKLLKLRYEDIIQNKEQEIQRIIEFCGLKVNEEAIQRAIHYSSFEYMKEHENKFGEQPVESTKVYNQFIRKGKVGEGKDIFNDDQLRLFHKKYDKILKPIEKQLFQ